MEVRLVTPTGASFRVALPLPGAKAADVVDWACRCGGTMVSGTGRHIAGRDTYKADAVCAKCGDTVGTLLAKVETLFGLEEDEAVLLYGRARVYGGTGGRRCPTPNDGPTRT